MTNLTQRSKWWHRSGRARFALLLFAIFVQACVTTYEDGRSEGPGFFANIHRFLWGSSLPEWKPDEVDPFMFYKPTELPVLLAPGPQGEIPSRTLIKNLPPALDQGSLPAGPAFSGGYLATTMLVRTRQSAYRCSPAFIFRMLNGSSDNAVEILDVLRFLQGTGCANWSLHPFNTPSDFTRQPSEAVIRDAHHYRISGFARVDLRDADQIRNHLLAGRPVLVSLVLPENLLRLDDEFLDWPRGNVIGRQSMAIVGIDTEKGAVLLQNSMGERWGHEGRAWIPMGWFVRLVIDAHVVY